MYDLIIHGGTVVDGSGGAPFKADVAVLDGKIAGIGDFSAADAKNKIDAAGRWITPGFFDMHSHADLTAMLCPDMEGLLGQGVTSVFTGHCGMTMAPIGDYFVGMLEDVKAFEEISPLITYGKGPGNYPAADSPSLRRAFEKRFGVKMDWTSFGDFRQYLRKTGVGANMYMLVGHAQIRMAAMGMDYKRTATQQEIDVMKTHVAEAMESGALGLSFGLDYAPGIFADDNELYQLAECLVPYKGILAAHTRRRGKKPGAAREHTEMQGYRDLMEIGLKTGLHVHISHISSGFDVKPADQELQDACGRRTLAIIDEYRAKGAHVTWDTLVPDYIPWFFFPELAGVFKYFIELCGGKTAFCEKLKSPTYRAELTRSIKEGKNPSFGMLIEDMEILRCKNESYVGRRLNEIAAEQGKTPIEMAFDMLMEDADTCYRQPPLGGPKETVDRVFDEAEEASMGLDNCAYDYDFEGERPDMPRDRSTPTSYCGMITFFEKRSDIPFEKLVQKLTGNAAKAIGIADRGFLREGMAADILVIDRENLRSNENFVDPRQKPDGIDYVIVDGRIAVERGEHSHIRAGRIIDRNAD